MSKYEKVEAILKQYKQALEDYNTHKELISLEIGVETKDEIIEGLSINAAVIDDMPKSITNKLNSKTENAATDYLYYLRPSPLELKIIEERNKEEDRLLQRIADFRQSVHEMLKNVSKENRFIILALYIHKLSINKTIEKLRKLFPESNIYSQHGLWNRKNIILAELDRNLKG